jgi:hypothetical protein
VIGRGAWRLDHHRDELLSLLPPAGQALEPVDDLILAFLGGYHTDRQLGHIIRNSMRRSGA